MHADGLTMPLYASQMVATRSSVPSLYAAERRRLELRRVLTLRELARETGRFLAFSQLATSGAVARFLSLKFP